MENNNNKNQSFSVGDVSFNFHGKPNYRAPNINDCVEIHNVLKNEYKLSEEQILNYFITRLNKLGRPYKNPFSHEMRKRNISVTDFNGGKEVFANYITRTWGIDDISKIIEKQQQNRQQPQQQVAPIQQITCNACKNSIPIGSKFCNHCGLKIEETPQEISFTIIVNNAPQFVVKNFSKFVNRDFPSGKSEDFTKHISENRDDCLREVRARFENFLNDCMNYFDK